MRSLKVGDKVKIKTDAENRDDAGVGWEPIMDNYIGEIVTINEVHSKRGSYFYRVEENSWAWSHNMLEHTRIALFTPINIFGGSYGI